LASFKATLLIFDPFILRLPRIIVHPNINLPDT
jgi:hypothetical protein